MEPTVFDNAELSLFDDMLTAARQNPDRVLVVDWENRTIKVIGPERDHETAKNHKGEPLRYRPIYVKFREKRT